MDILTTIGSVVASAGSIYSLVKDLKNDELLRQIGSLNRGLAQAEIEIAELMHKNHSLEQENQELKADKTSPLVWRKPFYWNESGDTPFCPHCYEESKLRYHLAIIHPTNNAIAHTCTHCNKTY